ncbi:MAG: hypothetical protein JSR47_02160 [Proteobacteria bacterium]|nr:hypothetical protein [Pseudomonadota bacterium]
MNWLLRGLMVLGGAILVYQGLPVMRASWQAQKADAVVMKVRRGEAVTLPEVNAGMAALNRAVAANPVAGRYLQRSELEAAAGLMQSLKLSEAERLALMKQSRADLELGLARAPARSIDWLRLAVMREAIDGPGRNVLTPFFMSLETGRNIEPIWRVTLHVIVNNWAYFSDAQKAELQTYVTTMWRYTSDQRMFATTVNNPIDELIIRNLLKDVPGAQENLTKWILLNQKS